MSTLSFPTSSFLHGAARPHNVSLPRVGRRPPRASARWIKQINAAGLAAGRLQPDSGTITGPLRQLIPPIHRLPRPWSRKESLSVSPSTREGQGSPAPRRWHRRQAPAKLAATSSPSPGPLSARRSGVRPRLAAMITRDAWTIGAAERTHRLSGTRLAAPPPASLSRGSVPACARPHPRRSEALTS